jgi:hypothetical protein
MLSRQDPEDARTAEAADLVAHAPVGGECWVDELLGRASLFVTQLVDVGVLSDKRQLERVAVLPTSMWWLVPDYIASSIDVGRSHDPLAATGVCDATPLPNLLAISIG